MALLALSLVIFDPVIIAGISVQIVLFGVGFSAFAVLVWSFMRDAVEYMANMPVGNGPRGHVWTDPLRVEVLRGYQGHYMGAC